MRNIHIFPGVMNTAHIKDNPKDAPKETFDNLDKLIENLGKYLKEEKKCNIFIHYEGGYFDIIESQIQEKYGNMHKFRFFQE